MSADIKTLEKLADKLTADALRGATLNAAAVASIANIIRESIGAPLMWPSRRAGAAFADDYYRGSNAHRLAFNHGVKWAVESYEPTIEVKSRYG